MLHQAWIAFLGIILVGGIETAIGVSKASDGKQARPVLTQRVLSAIVPMGSVEGQRAETKGVTYNTPEARSSRTGDLYSEDGGGLGPIEQSIAERGEANLDEPVDDSQIRIRPPIIDIEQVGSSGDTSMSESEEDRLELLIRNLPADQDLGAIAQGLQQDKTMKEIIPNLPGYRLLNEDTHSQIAQEEVDKVLQDLPRNKSIGPIETDSGESNEPGGSNPTNVLQNKTSVPVLLDHTETTELEGTRDVLPEGGRNVTPGPTVFPTIGITEIPNETTKEVTQSPQRPGLLIQARTTNNPQVDDSTPPVQTPKIQNPEPPKIQIPTHNAEATIDGSNGEEGLGSPEGKALLMNDPSLGGQVRHLEATASASVHQGPENGDGGILVASNQGNQPGNGWYFNSGYGYGGVQQSIAPVVTHQVVPRQVYGGVPQIVYGTVPVLAHGARYAAGYTLGQRPSPVRIPFIDRNGCKEPGDVTCSTDATDECNYIVCVLANENRNLWRRPQMEGVTEACPAGRGLVSEFCNTHDRLLRAIGFIKDEDRNRIKHYHHQKGYSMAKDPCILANAACTGG